MTKQLQRRLARVEAARPALLDPWVRRWLGHEVAPQELAHPEPRLDPDEEAALIASLPRELQAWLGRSRASGINE